MSETPGSFFFLQSHAIKSKLKTFHINLWRAMLKKYFFTNVTP